MISMKPRGLATNNTVDMETKPSEIQFENGSDHTVVASYSELYEEGEVEISTVHPTLPIMVRMRSGILWGGYVASGQQEKNKTMQYEELIQRPRLQVRLVLL